MITLLLVDDQFSVLQGWKLLFSLEPDFQVVAEANNGRKAIELARQRQPDVVLMDWKMPLIDGVEATAVIHALGLPSNVIIVSLYDTPTLWEQATEAGAVAFVAKQADPQKLIAAIRAVATSPSKV